MTYATLADEAGHDARAAARALQLVDGIGPTGADIYLREAQNVALGAAIFRRPSR